jgi:hypothetical protein
VEEPPPQQQQLQQPDIHQWSLKRAAKIEEMKQKQRQNPRHWRSRQNLVETDSSSEEGQLDSAELSKVQTHPAARHPCSQPKGETKAAAAAEQEQATDSQVKDAESGSTGKKRNRGAAGEGSRGNGGGGGGADAGESDKKDDNSGKRKPRGGARSTKLQPVTDEEAPDGLGQACLIVCMQTDKSKTLKLNNPLPKYMQELLLHVPKLLFKDYSKPMVQYLSTIRKWEGTGAEEMNEKQAPHSHLIGRVYSLIAPEHHEADKRAGTAAYVSYSRSLALTVSVAPRGDKMNVLWMDQLASVVDCLGVDPRVFVATLQWNKAGASAVKLDLFSEEEGGKYIMQLARAGPGLWYSIDPAVQFLEEINAFDSTQHAAKLKEARKVAAAAKRAAKETQDEIDAQEWANKHALDRDFCDPADAKNIQAEKRRPTSSMPNQPEDSLVEDDGATQGWSDQDDP